jgi:hypothetical protein
MSAALLDAESPASLFPSDDEGERYTVVCKDGNVSRHR